MKNLENKSLVKLALIKIRGVFKELPITLTRNLRLFIIKRALCKEVAGRDCFVLGSAPEPDLEGLDKDAVLICVNGSAANAARLGLKTPVMTVVDFELLDPSVNNEKITRSVIVKNRLLSGLDLGLLFVTQSNSSSGGTPECLDASYRLIATLYKSDCRSIVHNVTSCGVLENDVHGLLSRGGFAIALCAWGGAKRITFSGFSLFQNQKELHSPHFYESIKDSLDDKSVIWSATESVNEAGLNWDTRSHSLADSTLVAMLFLNGFDIRSNTKDFAPMLSNWGKNPPEWVKRRKLSLWNRLLLHYSRMIKGAISRDANL